MSTDPTPADQKSQFANEAQTQQTGIIREFTDLLLQNKKWWLLPIVVVLLLVGGLILIGGTAAAPFIYTLF
jgi:hypothetical protein